MRTSRSTLRHPTGTGTGDEITDELLPFIFGPTETLSDVARRLHCKIVVRDGERNLLAEFESNTYQRLTHNQIVVGETTIYGRLVRVGGATQSRWAFETSGRQRLLYCRVPNAEVARRLGNELLQGLQRWMKRGVLSQSARIDLVDYQKRTVKDMRMWMVGGGEAHNVLEGRAVYMDGAALVCATGAATLGANATAEPCLLVGRDGAEVRRAAQAVFSLSQHN